MLFSLYFQEVSRVRMSLIKWKRNKLKGEDEKIKRGQCYYYF